MPSGRSPPSGFGIVTRRTGSGRYVFENEFLAQARQPPLQARRLDLRKGHSVHCPAHPHLLGPTHRRVAGCPRGKSCRRAGRSGRQAPPSPYGTAFSEGSGSLSVLPGSSPITFTSPSSKAHQKSGPFAPPALPGLNAPTTLSDSRHEPSPVATLRPLPSPRDGSPPITRTTFPTCRAHYPGGSSGCACRLLPRSRGLPQMAGGSASALSLSRPAQASLTLRPAGLLSRLRRPLSRGSSPSGYPAEPLVSYQINRQLSGWNLPPLMIRAFGAHCQEETSAKLHFLICARTTKGRLGRRSATCQSE